MELSLKTKQITLSAPVKHEVLLSQSVFVAALKAMPAQALIVSEDGTILFINHLASLAFPVIAGFTAVDGKLKFRRRDEGLAFINALRNAATHATPSLITLRSRQSNPVLVLSLRPLAPGIVLVLVESLTDKSAPTHRLLEEVCGLTIAESRLAIALAGLCGLDASSSKAGVTVTTARKTLKSIFSKCGVNGQPALAAMLARLSRLA